MISIMNLIATRAIWPRLKEFRARNKSVFQRLAGGVTDFAAAQGAKMKHRRGFAGKPTGGGAVASTRHAGKPADSRCPIGFASFPRVFRKASDLFRRVYGRRTVMHKRQGSAGK